VQSVAHRQHHAATDGEQQRGGHQPQLNGVRVRDELQRSTHYEWNGWTCVLELSMLSQSYILLYILL